MTVCFPGILATKGNPYADLDSMWRAFDVYSSNKTLSVNSSKVVTQAMGRMSLGSSSQRVRSNASHVSQRAAHPSGSASNPHVMNIADLDSDVFDAHYNAWPLGSDAHWETVFTVTEKLAFKKTYRPSGPLWFPKRIGIMRT